MSDSTTNVEMRDVLSSIRKLVSDEKTPKKRNVASGTDKFILTPAHRVLVAEDANSADAPAPFRLPDAEMPQATATGGSDQGSGSTDEMDAGGAAEARPAVSSLESRIAELELAVGKTEEEWEPDGSEPEDDTPPARRLFEIVDNTRHDDELAAHQSDDQGDETSHRSDVRPTGPATAGVSEKGAPLNLSQVAMFSHFPARADNGMPSEGIAQDDGHGSVDTMSEIAEEIVRGEVLNGDDDVFVDEDVLRKVVAEVVREELQGKLGERITRNVRRLVRREIEQMLSLRDLD